MQVTRAEIDLLRGDTGAAAERWQQIYDAIPAHHQQSRLRLRGRAAGRGGSALWAGRPGDALREVRRALALFKAPDLTILVPGGCWRRACGRVPTWPGRPGRAATSRPLPTPRTRPMAWPPGSSGWAVLPFTDHPAVATIPA